MSDVLQPGRSPLPPALQSPAAAAEAVSNLLEQDHVAEAQRLLRFAIARFPDADHLLTKAAWLAFGHHDYDRAIALWEECRRRFPQKIDGYIGGGVALRDGGRFDDADALYREAFVRFPLLVNMLQDFAWVAERRGDIPESLRRWQVLRTLFPEVAVAYLRPCALLRDAGRFDEAADIIDGYLAREPAAFDALVERAWVAHRRRDWPDALRRWDRIATEFADRREGRRGACEALLELGRADDADTVLQPALRMFSDDGQIAALNGRIAMRRQDFASAVTIWEDVRSRFPNEVSGYTGGASAYLATGRLADADALLHTAIEHFPNDIYIAMDYARIPQHRQDHAEAANRWRDVAQRFPHAAPAIAGCALALAAAKQSDAAETLLAGAQPALAHSADIVFASATVAAKREDWAEAERRWRAACAQFADDPKAHVGLGCFLRERGSFDAAVELLSTALQRFPGHLDIEVQRALCLSQKRDWPRALPVWEDLKRRYPHEGQVQAGIAGVLWQARQDLAGTAEAEAGGPSFVIPASLLETPSGGTNAELCDLLGRFESIGDSCEFGIVQRRFGAEPLSLLRWASIPTEHLISALDNDFAGVGDPENTIIEVSNGEYTVREKRFPMFSHTFTPAVSVPLDKFTSLQARRMQFLRRKLVDDLATAAKIFVYKSKDGVDDSQLDRLFASLQRHSVDNALLCVRLEDAGHPCGHLEQRGPRLFVGYIDKFSTIDISVQTWITLCRQTAALLGPAISCGE